MLVPLRETGFSFVVADYAVETWVYKLVFASRGIHSVSFKDRFNPCGVFCSELAGCLCSELCGCRSIAP